jgi:hypothetical protein
MISDFPPEFSPGNIYGSYHVPLPCFQTAKKGMTKKSIFASPDNVNGRVGIGTCGMSGKPMTEFTTAEKWRKGV